jgi:photosystem II stability/assembly factor-like uncharacterized protein
MKNKFVVFTIIFLLVFSTLAALFWFVGETRAALNTTLPGSKNLAYLASSPTITDVQPSAAPNDVDAAIVIQGTAFTATISGTEVITAPLVYLGNTELADVIWANTTTLSATIPWGLEPEIYSLTVVNPDGVSVTLQNAFTVTQGFDEIATGGPYGGITKKLKLNPGDSSTVYGLMFGAGLFISENSAESWALIHDHDWPIQLDSDAVDSNILYLGADSNDLYRSEDNGENWVRISGDFQTQNGCFTTYPAAHPTDAGKVYFGMGSCGDIYLESDEGGVYFSNDFGAFWSPRNNGLTDRDVQALAIHPTSPDTLIAGTLDGDLFYTTDGGTNWTWSTQVTGTVSELYFNPYETLEAWAITRSDVEGAAYLYRSVNLTDWVLQNLPLSYSGGPTLAQMDFLPESVWLANINVYTSTDSGGTWNMVNSPMWGTTALAISPDNPQTIFVGTDFGVEKSTDAGTTWVEAVEGLAAIVPNAIAVSTLNPDTLYVKTHQGLYASKNGGNHWQYLNYGVGGDSAPQSLAVDPFDDAKLYLIGGCDNEFCIDISLDEGATWNYYTGTLPSAYTGWSCSSLTILPSPHTPNRVLVGAYLNPPSGGDVEGVFFASSNGGVTWSSVVPSQTIGAVTAMAYDALNPNLVYAATDGAGLWRSNNSGDSWVQVPVANKTNISVAAIAVHPNVSNKLYVRTYDFAAGPNPEGELWVSEDAGANWQPLVETFTGGGLLVSPPIPNQFVYSLYSAGATENVEGSSGLYRSYDEGQSWQLIPGAPRPNVLAAASDGERSIIYIGSPGGLATAAGEQASAPFTPAGGGVYRLLGGGVYRLTYLIHTEFTHLPLIMR